jgi:general stress protein 26
MSDVKQKIEEVLAQPQLAVMATITDDNKPWARYVFIMADGVKTIRCATVKQARKAAQIEKTSEVHLTCGISKLDDQIPYLQIQAKARIATDQEEKSAFWNPGLQAIFDGPEDPNYCVVIMEPYRIEYCTPEDHATQVWEK